MSALLPALFDGQDIFGSPAQFSAQELSVSTPAAIDAFLGNSPGTAKYGSQGPLVGISGVIASATSAAVTAAIANLTSFAGVDASFVLPPNISLVGGVTGYAAAYFSSTDLVPGTLTSGGSAWQQPYSLVLRITDGGQIGYPPVVAPTTPTPGTTTRIFSCGACSPVANTTAATSIFGSPTNPFGSLTIPKNMLKPGNFLRWILTGQFGCTGTPSVSVNAFLGSSNVLAQVSSAALSACTAHPVFSNQQNFISVLSTGSSATVAGVALLAWYPTVSNVTITAVPGGTTPAASATCDTTSDLIFDLKITWTVANALNTFTLTSFELFLDS